MLNYLMLIFYAEKPANQRTDDHNYCKAQKIACPIQEKEEPLNPGNTFESNHQIKQL